MTTVNLLLLNDKKCFSFLLSDGVARSKKKNNRTNLNNGKRLVQHINIRASCERNKANVPAALLATYNSFFIRSNCKVRLNQFTPWRKSEQLFVLVGLCVSLKPSPSFESKVMSFQLLGFPLLLLSYYIYQQLDSNDPEGRVTNAKVSDLKIEGHLQL